MVSKKTANAALLILSILREAKQNGVEMSKGDVMRKLGFPEHEACLHDAEHLTLTQKFLEDENQVIESLEFKIATKH